MRILFFLLLASLGVNAQYTNIFGKYDYKDSARFSNYLRLSKKADYSSNIRGTFTPFSHVDKGYTDSAIAANIIQPPVYTASNGLTKAGFNFKLGGSLVNNTTINTDAFSFNITGSGGVGLVSTDSDIDLSGQNVNVNSNLQVISTATFNDEALAAKKFDYTNNIRSTFTEFSHADVGYVDSSVTANIVDISGKLNISDTAAMLAPYLLESELPVITASNGLTKTVNNIKLGGTLTAPTTISTTGYNFDIRDTTDYGTGRFVMDTDGTNVISAKTSGGGAGDSVQLRVTSEDQEAMMQVLYGGGKTHRLFVNPGEVTMDTYDPISTSGLSLTFSTTSAQFFDGRAATKGLEYAGDYSAGFTNRSLIDKGYLTGIVANYQPLDADLTAIAALTPSNDDIIQRKAGVWTNRTPAQFKTDLALVKGDVGLGNVDNTSDLNKPISTATQTALNLKLNISDTASMLAGYLLKNASITGATKTKITYDAKGLVTAGADATTTDISEGSNLYFTDERAQDATGSMVDATLIYNDGIPSLGRAAIDGDVTISASSNTASITAGVIVNSDINAAAAIDATKLVDGSITNAELQYINSLTSNAQTQIDNKVTKGGDANAFSLGTTGAAQDLTIKLANTDRWTFDGTTGYLRRGNGLAINGLQLYGTGAGSILAFGDNFGSDPYVSASEYGGTDTDQFEAFGQKGFWATTGTKGSTSNLGVTQNGSVCVGTMTPVAATKLTISGATSLVGNLAITGNTTQTGNVTVTGNETITGFKKYKATTTPATPTNGTECNTYFKSNKFIIQYNDGGTVRYKYLDLTGTGVTWVHTVVAP